MSSKSSITEWEELKRSLAYKKYSRKIEEVIFRLPNGDESDFYIKREGPATSILALTPNNEVLLVRQFRPGPNKVLLEIPGGYIDEGEESIEAARRELLEETGYTGTVKFVVEALDDAYSTMKRSCFVATNCKKIAEPENTATEQTEVVLMSLEEFRVHLRSGQLTDVETGYLGLDFLHLLN